MKKVSLSFSKQLQQLLADDTEFKKLPVFRYSLAIVNFVVEVAATGICPSPNFPILAGDFQVPETIRLTESELALFVEVYKSASRIEAHITPGIVAVCLSTEIVFCARGQGVPLLLRIVAGADSMAVRKFEVSAPLTAGKLQVLYTKGLLERRQRNEKEGQTRSLARIGP